MTASAALDQGPARQRHHVTRGKKTKINFRKAKFSGGHVDFMGAEFSGGLVDFSGVQFSGGEVDFHLADDWSSPPRFDGDIRRPGVRLPAAAGGESQ